ncbi:rhodanese-like domain-containing protein [Methanobacterium formicicum]|uniref:Rhodanese-like protein n=1 Tax=Methanobacterium formicicum (strain DSM 3637 / PP1) TaxID=1204725 RepID=K2RQ05_METFP|nr:rhodanese-like domain-containing protein [Methanobacterium formicicum]EKF84815.1 rhodanese-like protein [Methanobacterium formicicum DSM 3637]
MFGRKPSSNSATDLDPNSAFEMILKNKQNPEFILLDVRTLGEYNQSHIEDSIQIDYQSRDFEKKVQELDKSKTYLVYCRSGMRSGASVDIMSKLGFKNLYNMAGGIMGWENCGLSVE